MSTTLENQTEVKDDLTAEEQKQLDEIQQEEREREDNPEPVDLPEDHANRILAHLALDPETAAFGLPLVEPEYFADNAHRAFVTTLKELHAQGGFPSKELIEIALRTRFDRMQQEAGDKTERVNESLRQLASCRVILEYCHFLDERAHVRAWLLRFVRESMTKRALFEYLKCPERRRDAKKLAAALLEAEQLGDETRGGVTRGYLPRDLMELPDPEWLVERHLTCRTTAVIYGRYQTCKSFYAVSMALAIATRKPFLGEFKVKPGRVAYVISEGADSFKKRLWAWCKHYGVDLATLDTLAVIPARFNLTDETGAEAANLVRVVREVLGDGDVMAVFIDTLAKNFGAGDPDKQQSMAVYVNNLERVAKQLGDPTVVSVHHVGKDAGRGPIGSISLPGAVEWMIETSGDPTKGKPVQVEFVKHKDTGDLKPYGLAPIHYDVPFDMTGEGTIVVVKTDAPAAKGGKADPAADAKKERDEVWEVATHLPVMPTGGKTVRELLEDTGLSRTTLDRRLGRGINAGWVLRIGTGETPGTAYRYALTTGGVDLVNGHPDPSHGAGGKG